MRIEGTQAGVPVRGLGFVERRGFSNAHGIDAFFAAVGRETRRQNRSLLPAEIDAAAARRLIAWDRDDHWIDGVDLEQFRHAVVRPIREIVDRGGKTWRSYGVLACIDAVGGDPEAFRHWLALTEILHVGSLIVDDVQDGSKVRRGGPSAHEVHSVPLAINAGSACYFFAETLTVNERIPAEKMLAILRIYFEAMRAAHAGQGLDIDGLHGLLPHVVETGDGELLEKRLHGMHRLKSAVPPSGFARIATLLGDGAREQMAGLSDLFEAFGLAFQIVDDVLNLKGFQGELKTRGEDISEGKITAPVAKAMSRLPLKERRALWRVLQSKPTEPAVVARVIETLTTCGAIAACEEQARQIIEDAWAKVDPLLPDSHAKVKLRAFGWYLLDRHY